MLNKSRIKGFMNIIVVVTVIAVVAISYVFIKNNSSNAPSTTTPRLQNILKVATPAPTPFPFQELTIPYLRAREYKSQLGALEKVSENQNYTSYLTNYDSDGLKINGLLTIPKNDKPTAEFPAVIFLHGYIPPEQYKTLTNYASYVDYLAKNGLVVFKIDLRGHDNSEGIPTGGYYSGDYVIDTLNAHAALKSSDFVDSEKIGLWGHSMAGNIVFRSVVSKQIPAAVIWAGAVYSYEDFDLFDINDNSYRPPSPESEQAKRRKALFDAYGEFNTNSDFWKQVAPTNYLDGVTGSIQVHHALDDNVVGIGFSRNLMSLLEGTSIKHELREYNSGGHNLTGSTFNAAMNATVEFFKENL